MTWTPPDLTDLLMVALAFSMALNLGLLRPSRMAPYTQLIKQLSGTIRDQQNTFERILEVVESTAGGISKRVWENIEIAESIYSRAPELFKQCPSLIYDLHATEQFLNALFDAMTDRLDRTQRELVARQRTEREAVFNRICDAFDLERPPRSEAAQ